MDRQSCTTNFPTESSPAKNNANRNFNGKSLSSNVVKIELLTYQWIWLHNNALWKAINPKKHEHFFNPFQFHSRVFPPPVATAVKSKTRTEDETFRSSPFIRIFPGWKGDAWYKLATIAFTTHPHLGESEIFTQFSIDAPVNVCVWKEDSAFHLIGSIKVESCSFQVMMIDGEWKEKRWTLKVQKQTHRLRTFHRDCFNQTTVSSWVSEENLLCQTTFRNKLHLRQSRAKGKRKEKKKAKSACWFNFLTASIATQPSFSNTKILLPSTTYANISLRDSVYL